MYSCCAKNNSTADCLYDKLINPVFKLDTIKTDVKILFNCIRDKKGFSSDVKKSLTRMAGRVLALAAITFTGVAAAFTAFIGVNLAVLGVIVAIKSGAVALGLIGVGLGAGSYALYSRY